MGTHFNRLLRGGLILCLFLFSFPVFAQVIELPDCDLFPTNLFCPQPTPSIEPDPIVFVPGIVASFNKKVLFKDKAGGYWNFVPFGNIYAGLLWRLQKAGYVENKNLFIAYYDWRHPNTQSAAEYLAPMIAKAKEHSSTGKVDIIAHSMGGLLAQQYIASDKFIVGEIDQLIMLGTPNTGASDAYLPWEGGVLPTTWDKPTKFYVKEINAVLNSVKKLNLTAPLSYRQFFPSLKELLPTGTYITKDGATVPREDLTEQNPFLAALQTRQDDLLNADGITVTTIAGTDKQTIDTIALKSPRTAEDIALGRWRDGHPTQEIPLPNTGNGDQTVLTSSALFGSNKIILSGVSHTQLPEYAQDEVLAALGVSTEGPKKFIYQEPKWLTGFVVLSPIDIVITDAKGKTVSKNTNDFGDDAFVDVDPGEDGDDPKIIILQNLPAGTYTVHLTGTDTGPYTVITTQTDDTSSTTKTLTGNTVPGKQESFTVTIGVNGLDVSEIHPQGPVGGGTGNEQDCCPGHNPVTAKKASKGKVLGISTKTIQHKKGAVTLEELKPLNDIFLAVYERLPTFDEWKYWARRYSTDKRDWEAIKGAMYWHRAREVYTNKI